MWQRWLWILSVKLSLTACGGEPGAAFVRVQTPLQLPRDVDALELHVSVSATHQVLYRQSYALREGQTFPLSFSLRAASEKEARLLIKITASKERNFVKEGQGELEVQLDAEVELELWL